MDAIVLLILLAVLALPLLFSARKQRRQMREAQELQNSLVVGDRVMTTSGMYGTVTDLGDETLELEIAPDIYTTWLKAAIRKRVEDEELEDLDEDEDLDEGEVLDEGEYEEVDDIDGEEAPDVERVRDDSEPATDAAARSDRS